MKPDDHVSPHTVKQVNQLGDGDVFDDGASGDEAVGSIAKAASYQVPGDDPGRQKGDI